MIHPLAALPPDHAAAVAERNRLRRLTARQRTQLARLRRSLIARKGWATRLRNRSA